MTEKTYRAVYVWQLPVRWFHIVNIVSMLVLGVTGFLIGNPPALMNHQEASFGYWFGTTRFIHFAAAYIFTLNLLVRIYWSFMGNSYAGWRNFIPTTQAKWQEMRSFLNWYITLRPVHGRIPLSHNSLAGFSYFLIVLLSLFQAMTGFALYTGMSEAWFPSLFGWVVSLFGNEMAVRQWHHIALWVFVVFTVVHLYIVWLNDSVEKRGLFSSIATGFKLVEKE